jgi:hypothetical protein
VPIGAKEYNIMFLMEYLAGCGQSAFALRPGNMPIYVNSCKKT